MSKFYRGIYKVFAGLIRKLYRIEIIGAENEPETGPFIVCANHISNHDVVVLAASLKNQVHYLAKAELFRVPLLRHLIKALGAFPLERGKGDVGAIKKTIRLLGEGNVVGFYPQGHRFPGVHPATTNALPGIGLIVTKAHTSVLPVAIETKNYRMKMFRKTRVIIGKPIYFDEMPITENNKNDFPKIADKVFGNICSLLPPAGLNAPANENAVGENETEKDS